MNGDQPKIEVPVNLEMTEHVATLMQFLSHWQEQSKSINAKLATPTGSIGVTCDDSFKVSNLASTEPLKLGFYRTPDRRVMVELLSHDVTRASVIVCTAQDRYTEMMSEGIFRRLFEFVDAFRQD